MPGDHEEADNHEKRMLKQAPGDIYRLKKGEDGLGARKKGQTTVVPIPSGRGRVRGQIALLVPVIPFSVPWRPEV